MKKLFITFILASCSTMLNAQVKVLGKIEPNGLTDTYPTHVDSLGKGGLIAVGSWQERNSIPTARRKAGMLVRVKSATIDSTYTIGGNLTNVDWAPYITGANITTSGALQKIGNDISIKNSPLLEGDVVITSAGSLNVYTGSYNGGVSHNNQGDGEPLKTVTMRAGGNATGNTADFYTSSGLNAYTFDKPIKINGVNVATVNDISGPVDISGKEDKSNKATNLASPSNTTYPTTQAVVTSLAAKADLNTHNQYYGYNTFYEDVYLGYAKKINLDGNSTFSLQSTIGDKLAIVNENYDGVGQITTNINVLLNNGLIVGNGGAQFQGGASVTGEFIHDQPGDLAKFWQQEVRKSITINSALLGNAYTTDIKGDGITFMDNSNLSDITLKTNPLAPTAGSQTLYLPAIGGTIATVENIPDVSAKAEVVQEGGLIKRTNASSAGYAEFGVLTNGLSGAKFIDDDYAASINSSGLNFNVAGDVYTNINAGELLLSRPVQNKSINISPINIGIKNGNYTSYLQANTTTSNTTITLPAANGTLATIEDILEMTTVQVQSGFQNDIPQIFQITASKARLKKFLYDGGARANGEDGTIPQEIRLPQYPSAGDVVEIIRVNGPTVWNPGQDVMVKPYGGGNQVNYRYTNYMIFKWTGTFWDDVSIDGQ